MDLPKQTRVKSRKEQAAAESGFTVWSRVGGAVVCPLDDMVNSVKIHEATWEGRVYIRAHTLSTGNLMMENLFSVQSPAASSARCAHHPTLETLNWYWCKC